MRLSPNKGINSDLSICCSSAVQNAIVHKREVCETLGCAPSK